VIDARHKISKIISKGAKGNRKENGPKENNWRRA
jgi:hypothetical protein